MPFSAWVIRGRSLALSKDWFGIGPMISGIKGLGESAKAISATDTSIPQIAPKFEVWPPANGPNMGKYTLDRLL